MLNFINLPWHSRQSQILISSGRKVPSPSNSGQKIAQSSKVKLSQCQAVFSETLTISCNMIFDHPNKTFISKIVVNYSFRPNSKSFCTQKKETKKLEKSTLMLLHILMQEPKMLRLMTYPFKNVQTPMQG